MIFGRRSWLSLISQWISILWSMVSFWIASMGGEWSASCLPSYHQQPLLCGILQGSVLTSLLFNIYVKLLDENVHHHGARCLRMRCNYTSDELSNAVDILSQYLEVVGFQMESNRVQLSPGKTDWALGLGVSWIWDFTIFYAGWVGTAQNKPIVMSFWSRSRWQLWLGVWESIHSYLYAGLLSNGLQ